MRSRGPLEVLVARSLGQRLHVDWRAAPGLTILTLGRRLNQALSQVAAAESVMSTIKTELVKRERFRTRDQARLEVFGYIEGSHNPLRRHSALGYLSPVKFEE